MFQSPPARRSALCAGLPFALATLMAGPPVVVGAWVQNEASAARVISTVVGQRKQVTLGARGAVSLNTTTLLRVCETTDGCESRVRLERVGSPPP
jgi:ferric-dicitrate binding protein FerR (iron transport regulator)